MGNVNIANFFDSGTMEGSFAVWQRTRTRPVMSNKAGLHDLTALSTAAAALHSGR